MNARCYPASLQVNGGPLGENGVWSGFVAFDTPGLTLAQLEAVARYYYGLGYGFVCPTMVTASPEAYQSNLPVFRAARDHEKRQKNCEFCDFHGDHLVGNWRLVADMCLHRLPMWVCPSRGFVGLPSR